jgi:hypothetical protein
VNFKNVPGLILGAVLLMGSDATPKLSQYAIVNQQIADANAVIKRHHRELYREGVVQVWPSPGCPQGSAVCDMTIMVVIDGYSDRAMQTAAVLPNKVEGIPVSATLLRGTYQTHLLGPEMR